MEMIQPCPSCLSDVDVIRVKRNNKVERGYYFFIHCKQCGKGTSNSYPSVKILAAIWNALVFEKYNMTINVE